MSDEKNTTRRSRSRSRPALPSWRCQLGAADRGSSKRFSRGGLGRSCIMPSGPRPRCRGPGAGARSRPSARKPCRLSTSCARSSCRRCARKSLRRIAVACAAHPATAATFTAVNLARSLSRVPGCKTVLLDLNLRSPGHRRDHRGRGRGQHGRVPDRRDLLLPARPALQ